MTATTDFLPFAAASGANVEPQSSYATDSVITNGFPSGTLTSLHLNKVLRQSTAFGAALGQMLVNLNISTFDDGNTSNLTSQLTSGITAIATGAAASPTSTIIFIGTTTVPTGYLAANGAAVSRTTYANLFAVIGTTFGTGDGSTTFNLPDLRGQFIRGYDNGAGVDPSRTFGSSQADAFASHAHSLPLNSAYVQYFTVGGSTYVNYTFGGATGNTGGTETRPKNIALLGCIKY